jgi:hypothetical protein
MREWQELNQQRKNADYLKHQRNHRLFQHG